MARKMDPLAGRGALSPMCPSPLSPSSPNIVDAFGPLPLEHSPKQNKKEGEPVSAHSSESMDELLLAEASTLRLATPPRQLTAPMKFDLSGGGGNITARDLVFEGFANRMEATSDDFGDDHPERKSSESLHSWRRMANVDENACPNAPVKYVTASELLEEKKILIKAIQKCHSQRCKLQKNLRAAERARDARHDMMLRLRDRVKADIVLIEDLKSRKSELEKACAKRETEYPDLRPEVAELQQQTHSLNSALTLLEAENADLKGVLLNCRSDLDEEQQTCSLLKKSNADLKMQLKVLEQEREDLIAREREVSSENSRVQQLTKEVGECQENIRRLKKREKDLVEECRKHEQRCLLLDSKEAKIKELEAMIEEHELMRKNHAMSRLRLEGDLNKEKGESNGLQIQLMELKKTVDQEQQRLEEDNYKLVQKLSHAKHESERLFKELESMQKRYSGVDLELGKLKLRLSDKTKELEEFKKKRMEDHQKMEQERLARKNQQRQAAKRISDLEAHLVAEGGMVASLQKNLNDTKEQLKGRDTEVQQLRATSAQTSAAENELRNQLQASEAEKTQLEEDVAIERVKYAHLETKNAELEAWIRDLQCKMKAVEKELRVKEKAVSHQKGEIEHARSFFKDVGQLISEKDEEVAGYKCVLNNLAQVVGSDTDITQAVVDLLESRKAFAARAKLLERKGNEMGLELDRLQVKLDTQSEELEILRPESAQLYALRFRASHECRKQKLVLEDMNRLKAEHSALQHKYKEEKQINKFLKIMNSMQNPPKD
ncbi:hypothetical protein BSKO_04503 [Bryopsis sp. KO-2023]|nr:hypothetical protein BSKO_04503 [Bryopsis sp. KO-2023]